MLTGEGTSITEAVVLAAQDELGISAQDVDYEEINLGRYTPTELYTPDADEADGFTLYQVTVYADDGTAVGYGIRADNAKYGTAGPFSPGRPVHAEVHEESARV